MEKQAENITTNRKNETVKPSRWWVIFHLWGGVCFMAYIDASGLTKFFSVTPSSTDPTSATNYAETTAMVAISAITIGYFLSKFLIKLVDDSATPNRGKIIIKTTLPIAYFTGAVLLAMVTAPIFSSSGIQQKISPPTSQQAAMKPVITLTTSQNSEGVKEADLDQASLQNLQAWVVEKIRQKGRNEYAKMGYSPKDFKPKITANSVYVNTGRKKLAVIKVKMDNSFRSVTIMGFKQNELHRVICIRASNHYIPVWSGECGKKVHETFGASIQLQK